MDSGNKKTETRTQQTKARWIRIIRYLKSDWLLGLGAAAGQVSLQIEVSFILGHSQLIMNLFITSSCEFTV